MPTEHDPLWKHLVRDWQKPVYNLAHRMLGNRADAEDATQDTFIRLFDQLERYDTSRPLGPWVYRVATNVVLNRIRHERVRTRGRVAGAPEPAREETPVDVESQALVHEHLESVSPDARAALVLHFHLGLSKREIAEVLDVPRTTIQSRVAKGLGALRDSLTRAGHVALVPAVEGVMRDAPRLAVPSRLSDTLLSIAATPATAGALGAAAVGTIAIGGIVMTKQLLIGAAAAALLLLGTGYVAGRVLASDGDPSTADTAREIGPDGRALADVAAENERLRDELAALRAPGPGLEGGPRATSAGAAPTPDTPTAAPAGAGGAGGASAKPRGVDFTKFAQVMDENLELLLETQKLAQADMSREQERAAIEVLTENMRVSREANALARYPFFDERVLPGLVDSVYSVPLGLSDGERAGQRRQVVSILSRHMEGVDLEEIAAIERFAKRQQIMREIDESFAAAPDAKGRLESIRQVARRVLAGGVEQTSIGVTERSSEGSTVNQVVDRWKDVYDIQDEATLEELRAPAAGFVRRATDTLQHHGLFRDGATWDPQSNGAVAEAMARAQIEAERAFLGRLTDEQRATGRRNVPNVIVFEYGQGRGSIHVQGGI